MARRKAVCDECGGDATLIVVDVGDRQAEFLCWACLMQRVLAILQQLHEPVAEEQATEETG